jgi:hypothetical protein
VAMSSVGAATAGVAAGAYLLGRKHGRSNTLLEVAHRNIFRDRF